MRWTTHSERTIESNRWFRRNVADVELPDGGRIDHYLLRQRPVALTAVLDDREHVLMLWRHRFIPDTWGWELPSGVVEEGEPLERAAARETLEETGWQPGPLHPLLTLETSAGFSDATHHAFYANGATYVGPPDDPFESDRVDWVPLFKVPDLITNGEIRAANTMAALLVLLHKRL
jgi:8-oxo-dGTP pyrophosphatase MutT (NUDIX family)